MRTPNCECLICKKQMYRRPFELKKVRFVACFEHRNIAQSMFEQTEKQKEALKLGRVKGTNHRNGYKHKEESKLKCSISHKVFYKLNPDFAKQRVKNNKGETHYRWKGGASTLNLSIRQMNENRKWAEKVKQRDNYKCCLCGSNNLLESHHIKPLGIIIEELNIKNKDDALLNKEIVFDINNGLTLCQDCHYKIHNRSKKK